MQVTVLGAGVVGVTTAYFLVEAGHTVTLIDREHQVAGACSFANGSQLSYSYTDAMATPAFLARIPRLLAGFDTGIQFRAPLSADLLHWGRAFLAQCTTRKADANMLHTLLLAKRSRELLGQIRNRIDDDFSYRSAGKIVLLSGERERQEAIRTSALKTEHGGNSSVICLDEAIGIEPAIQHMKGNYRAAVHSPGDDVGDAHAFSRALARHLSQSSSCNIQLSTEIRRILVGNNCVRGIATSHGVLDTDMTVVCLGAFSPQLLKTIGIRQRIYPARGYSITLPPGSQSNSVSVTDPGARFVLSRLSNSMRIAGFADFVGYRTTNDTNRIRQLIATARQRAPLAADFGAAKKHEWGGFRPLTPDGRPIVGATPISGLYLNTGHGSLGWTLACASAETLANSLMRSPV